MVDPATRLMRAMRGGATAAEIDALLLEVKLEREIRRRAAEILEAKLSPRNLAVIGDLMKAAIELTG